MDYKDDISESETTDDDSEKDISDLFIKNDKTISNRCSSIQRTKKLIETESELFADDDCEVNEKIEWLETETMPVSSPQLSTLECIEIPKKDIYCSYMKDLKGLTKNKIKTLEKWRENEISKINQCLKYIPEKDKINYEKKEREKLETKWKSKINKANNADVATTITKTFRKKKSIGVKAIVENMKTWEDMGWSKKRIDIIANKQYESIMNKYSNEELKKTIIDKTKDKRENIKWLD